MIDEELVMGGEPREVEPYVNKKLPTDAEKRGPDCEVSSANNSKDKNVKKKKTSRPSEVEGMDIKTKRSAEKLAGDLVEIIKGLPASTRPEDIFEGVKDRFRDAGTHLYPIICGTVYSRNKPRKSIGIQVEADENIRVGGNCFDTKLEKVSADADTLDESKGKDDEQSKRGWRSEKRSESLVDRSGETSPEEMSVSAGWDVIESIQDAISDVDEIQTPDFSKEYEVVIE